MAFEIFQTDTAVLKKMKIDGTGSFVEEDTIMVSIDPNFKISRTFDDNGEAVSGHSSIVTSKALNDFWDATKRYTLDYKGRDWSVREASPQNNLGSNNLDHLKVIVT